MSTKTTLQRVVFGFYIFGFSKDTVLCEGIRYRCFFENQSDQGFQKITEYYLQHIAL